MHSALFPAIHYDLTTEACALVVIGGIAIFRTWTGIVLVVAGLLIVPWHYFGWLVLAALIFATSAVCTSD